MEVKVILKDDHEFLEKDWYLSKFKKREMVDNQHWSKWWLGQELESWPEGSHQVDLNVISVRKRWRLGKPWRLDNVQNETVAVNTSMSRNNHESYFFWRQTDMQTHRHVLLLKYLWHLTMEKTVYVFDWIQYAFKWCMSLPFNIYTSM